MLCGLWGRNKFAFSPVLPQRFYLLLTEKVKKLVISTGVCTSSPIRPLWLCSPFIIPFTPMHSLKKRRVFDLGNKNDDPSIPRIIITVPVRLIPEVAHLGVATLPRSLFSPVSTPSTILLDTLERRGDKYLWQWISQYLNIEDLWALNRTDHQRIINFRFILHGGCSSYVVPEVQALYLTKLGEVFVFSLCYFVSCGVFLWRSICFLVHI